MKSAGKTSNGGLEPDESRLQALYLRAEASACTAMFLNKQKHMRYRGRIVNSEQTRVSGYTLELIKQQGGNLHTNSISLDNF